MIKETENPYDELKNIFHEPKRLAIMSALCAADSGLTFNELKQHCNTSDGNLNRHLKVLHESGAVTVKKKFVGVKPQTTVYLSRKGVKKFSEYLTALAQVLNQTLEAMPEAKKEINLLSCQLFPNASIYK
jgi:DNA-binding HxlR family transcriptional regulator